MLPSLPVAGQALDLGCGPGDITLRFARAFPQWSIDGIDGATAMLQYGHTAVEAAGLQERVRLWEAYLPVNAPKQGGKGLPLQPGYDCILSNSLLHHLKDPMVLWQSIQQWSLPRTSIFVMDLMRPESLTVAQQLVDCYVEGEPEVLRHDFYHSLLAAYTVTEIEQQLVQAGLSHLQVKAVSDRHFIVWGQSLP